MNNLSELQGELHRLAAALDALSRQAEDLKPQETDDAQDFSALDVLARQNPIRNPLLSDADEFEQGCYLRLLCTAASLEDAIWPDRLLYLCRLGVGSGCARPASELLKMAYDVERLNWQSAAVSLDKLSLPLLLDMMMLGNLTGPAGERTLSFIASTAELLSIGEEDVSVIAQLAAAVLTQDESNFQKIEVKRPYSALGYLLPEQWLKNCRMIQEEYLQHEEKMLKCTYKVFDMTSLIRSLEAVTKAMAKKSATASGSTVSTSSAAVSCKALIQAKESVPSGTFVTRGSAIVSFEREFVNKEDESKYEFADPNPPALTASKSGFVFFTGTDDVKKIHLISPFDDPGTFRA